MSNPIYQSTFTTSPAEPSIVAGVPGKLIRVLALAINPVSDSVTLRFYSSTGPVYLSGPIYVSTGSEGPVASSGSVVLPFSAAGWMQTNSGDGLSASLTTGTGVVSILLVYELIDAVTV